MNRKERRANKTLQKNEYQASVIECSQSFILQLSIPKKVLNNLKAYARESIGNNKSIDHKNYLVGEIENGSELLVDENDPKVNELALKVRSLAVSYINEYQKRVPAYNVDVTNGLNVTNDSIWLNIMKKGDYNPYHDHATKSPTGLSWFLYIKVPEDMNKYETASPLGSEKYHNGCTTLHYGYSYHDSISCMQSLVLPPKLVLNPIEGQLYIFPKWLKHQVYPHSCDGERISMAGNISIFL